MFTLSADSITAWINSILDKEISAATAAGWTGTATELSAIKALVAQSPQTIAAITSAVNLAISGAEAEVTTLLGELATKAISALLGAGSLVGVVAAAQAPGATQATAGSTASASK